MVQQEFGDEQRSILVVVVYGDGIMHVAIWWGLWSFVLIVKTVACYSTSHLWSSAERDLLKDHFGVGLGGVEDGEEL